MSESVLRIATRKSALALWQAEHVAGLLRRQHAGLQVELVPLSTRGDEILDRSLATVGGKGLFLKELELAMQDGRADMAVHSLKDVPVDLDDGFILAAMLARADPADAFVSGRWQSLAELPKRARVGTSSLRRKAQLTAQRPDLEIADLRGNVHTRLGKLDRGEYDAIVLAAAGLQRLDLAARIRERFIAPDWLAAPGQAALCVESRAGDARVRTLVEPLNDANTHVTCTAERAMNRALGGSCVVPVGAWCVSEGQDLTLYGLVGDPATGRMLRADARGGVEHAEALGREVAGALLDLGAAEFLHAAPL